MRRTLTRIGVACALALATLALLAPLTAQPTLAATITVTTAADENAGGTGGACSLREAITAANTNANYGGCTAGDAGTPDTIRFSIGTGAQTITLTAANGALPAITGPTIIDGTTQPGFTGTPLIDLDGGSLAGAIDGLVLSGGNSTIRGLLIRRFPDVGIRITSAGNTVAGNFIRANASNGVAIIAAANNTIGGTVAGDRNVISANGQAGVNIRNAGATGNEVRGNYIGTNVAGTAGQPNGEDGVFINNDASNNVVGGAVSGSGNRIAFNGRDGVRIAGGTGNRIRENAIFSNTGLGINLGTDGVTANDSDDPDSGPNALQNYPVLTLASTGSGNIRVKGTLNSTPNTSFRVEFFSSASCDGSGNGEGQTFLGVRTVTTDGGGDATIDETITVSVVAGTFITATATNGLAGGTGDTSEFSACIAATANAAPAADDDTYNTNEDTPLTVPAPGVLDGDTDAEGDPLTVNVTPVSGPTNVGGGGAATGTLTLNADGSFTYTPGANDPRDVSFVYQVSDGRGGTDTAIVTIAVAGQNDAPANTVPGAQATNEDTPLNIAGLAITDLDQTYNPGGTYTANLSVTNGTLTVTPAGGVTVTDNGTANVTITGPFADVNATLNNGGNGVTYTPALNYNGGDTLTFAGKDNGYIGAGDALSDTDTVAITVNAVNDAPAANSGSTSTNEDQPVTFDLGGGDIDSGALTFSIVSQPANGAVTLNGTATCTPSGAGTTCTQSVTYTPQANNSADTSFTFQVCDNGSPSLCSAPATVSITVTGVNDAPVNTVPGAQTTNQNTALLINGIAVGDVDQTSSPGGTYTVNLSVTNGTLTVTPADSVTVLGNGTSAVQITGLFGDVNTTLGNGVTYTPTANYTGPATLTVVSNDGGHAGTGGPLTDTDQVAISVTAPNAAPVANADGYTTDQNTTLTVPVPGILGNDTDANGDDLDATNVSAVSPAGAGTVSVDAETGAFTFTPSATFFGAATFTYQATDGTANSNTATVTIRVRAATVIDNVTGTATYGDANATLRARLRTATGALPLNGKELVFTYNGTNYPATTGADGYAQVSVPLASGQRNAGNYANAFTVSFAGDTENMPSSATGDLRVAKRVIFIKPVDKSRPVGQPNPPCEIQVAPANDPAIPARFRPNQLAPGDTIAVFDTSGLVCRTAAGPNSAPGRYTLTASGVTAANYEVRYLTGILTVTRP